MGQAAVDLPDPLQAPPTSATSADDLLSQLAGDEIDRLLTESDVEPADDELPADAPTAVRENSATPNESNGAADPYLKADSTSDATPDDPKHLAGNIATQPTPTKSTSTEAMKVSVDGFTEQLPGAPATMEEASPADPISPALAAAEIDAVLSSSISGTSLPAGESALPKISSADLDLAVAADAERILAPQTSELQAHAADIAAASIDADERQELLATVAAESTEDPDEVRPLPIWLRPLEWLNAPMDAFSDATRDFLGKAALLTLVNAAAVIVYVLMFRRH